MFPVRKWEIALLRGTLCVCGRDAGVYCKWCNNCVCASCYKGFCCVRCAVKYDFLYDFCSECLSIWPGIPEFKLLTYSSDGNVFRILECGGIRADVGDGAVWWNVRRVSPGEFVGIVIGNVL